MLIKSFWQHRISKKILELVFVQLEIYQKRVAVFFQYKFKYSWNNTKYYDWTVKRKKRRF